MLMGQDDEKLWVMWIGRMIQISVLGKFNMVTCCRSSNGLQANYDVWLFDSKFPPPNTNCFRSAWDHALVVILFTAGVAYKHLFYSKSTFHGNLQAYIDLVGDFVPWLLKLMLDIWELPIFCGGMVVVWSSMLILSSLLNCPYELQSATERAALTQDTYQGSQQLLMACQGYNVAV